MTGDLREKGREQSHRSNNLDIMRLVLAAAVLLAHAYEVIDGNRSREPLTRIFHTISLGDLAVDGFFVLSGFVIAMSWERQPSVLRFMMNRVLRIYPGFAVAYLFSVVVVGVIGAASATAYLASLSPVQIASEIVNLKVPTHPATFVNSFYPVVNGAMWTIHYEFGCYLLVAAIGVTGLLKRRAFVLGGWISSWLRSWCSGGDTCLTAGPVQ